MPNFIGDLDQFDFRKSVFDYQLIKLEFSSACNAKCSYCLMRKHNNKPSDFISPENLKSFLKLNSDYIKNRSLYIEPYFNGESLLHPLFFDLINIIENSGCLIGELDTNLSLPLDTQRLAKIKFRGLTVNIGGITQEVHESVMNTSFELAINNLKNLYNEPERKFPMYLKINPVKLNIYQLKDIEKFLNSIGVNIPIKVQKTGIPVPTDYCSIFLKKIINDIYDHENPNFFRFKIEPDGHRIIVKEKNFSCIYQIPCINADGSLTFCSHDQLRHFNLGNTFITPLSELINSNLYKRACLFGRKKLHNICKGCN